MEEIISAIVLFQKIIAGIVPREQRSHKKIDVAEFLANFSSLILLNI